MDLEKEIRNGESETVEFKKSTALLTKVGETLCGFLNHRGGRVFVGVSAEGKIIGQHVSDHTIQEIAELLKKFEPPVSVDVERIPVPDGKEVLLFSAFARKTDMPYVFAGRPYLRVGTTTSVMPQHTYQKLLLDRDYAVHRWENQVAEGYRIEDLDTEEIVRTVRAAASTGRLSEFQGENVILVLERLGLLKDQKLLNAAVVLFGKKFLPDFPQCQLRMARFQGTDKSEFFDQNQVTGNAFFLLEQAMAFVRKHLPVAGKILPGVLERKDEPLFPFAALREALVNAFCHRSYSSPGGVIGLAIFDDRLEIQNDGTLPTGITSFDLKKEHASHQRNPLISGTFYLRGLVERWGRGTQKIVSLCVKAGHPEPEFFEQTTLFVARFLSNAHIGANRIYDNLKVRHQIILRSLAAASPQGLSFKEIKERITESLADRTLRDEFQYLKKRGIIDVVGRGRSAKWSLVLEDDQTNKAENKT